MKKRLLTAVLALALAMASMLMLASCDLSGLGGGTTCTSHKDENKDHKCDTCEKVLTTCADTDKDGKCDTCSKVLTPTHTCNDTNKDHKCDSCDEILSQCADGDTDGRCDICGEAMIPAHTCEDTYPKDHKCDVCDKKLSEHTDQNNDHRCDHCYNRATYCADADNDHACDICTEVKTSCMDGDNNGACDICDEAVTVTEGADGSALRTENPPFAGYYGVAATNTATDFSRSTLFFLPGLDSYRFYLYFSFELDDLVFTDGAEYGSFVAEEGYIKDGRFIVPVTYTPNGTQLCTEIGVQYMKFTKRATGQTSYLTSGIYLRFVLNCVVPSFLGVSADGNYAAASDTVTINFTDIVNAPADGFYIYLHFDNQVGGGRIHGNNFNNYRNYALYEDGIYTLKCELNAAQIGSHKPIITFTYIPADIGLKGIVDLYNTFTLVVEPGTPCAECSENKQYPDGYCDTCGNPLPPCDHTDTDKDHKCDLCAETISQCADADKDHKCDLCEKELSQCTDANKNHKCDICEKTLSQCTDADKDHKCDTCEKVLSTCADTDEDGKCDTCSRPIAGADLLKNPYLIGYSTDPREGFFEGLGMIELKYGVATTLYLKFNCEVKDFTVHFPSGEAASTYYDSDLTGVVYRIEIPAFDHIFPQGGTEFSFATDYAESSAIISYCCLPDPMPEYLGAMVNGALQYDTVSVKQGESATVQFAMNVAVNLDHLSLDGSYLVISDWSKELVEDGGKTYYLYTVTFTQGYTSADEFELRIDYSYLGASSEFIGGMLPIFTIRVSVSRYHLLGATVNGFDVLSDRVQIPYNTSYEILLSVNQSADAIRLATDAGIREGELFSDQGPFVYRFAVTEFSMSYVTAQVLAVSGNTNFPFGTLSFEILEQTGGEGGEGGGEGTGGGEVQIPKIVGIYDRVNEIFVQEKDVFHIWADGKLSIQITFDIPVAESYIKWNDRIYRAEIAPGENSYDYTVMMPMSKSKEEGTFKLCFNENEIWSEPYEFSYKKEAAAFYGIYTKPLMPDINHPSFSVSLPEGQTATVYLAMTAAVEPMELYIAGIDYQIKPLYNPWQEGRMIFTDSDGDPIHIWFYTVELPAEVLSSEYGTTVKLAFLQSYGEALEDYYYDDIYATYSIHIAPAV